MNFQREKLEKKLLRDFDDRSSGSRADLGSEEGFAAKLRAGFSRKWLIGGALATAAIGFTILSYNAYISHLQNSDPSQLPLAQADTSPVRVAPEDPGGMEIPNRDKTIYNVLANEQQALPKVERVLPPPEEPVKVAQGEDEILAGNLPNKEPVPAQKLELPKAEAKKEKAVKEVKEAPAVAAKPAKMEMTVAKAEPAKKLAELKTAAGAKSNAEAPKAVASLPASGTRIQLGAFKSEQEANNTWKKIVKLHADVLGSTAYAIERKDLGDKGIFYRLQAGPLDTAAAKEACKKLIERKQGCFVVRAG